MVASISLASNIRDKIHNLDLNLIEHREIYDQSLKEFIKHNELNFEKGKLKIDYSVYKDDLGNKTIGIGFNMDASTARGEWQKVFGNDVSFDKIYNEELELDDNQVNKLFDYSINIRREGLKAHFKGYWEHLKPNERLMIEDANYNSPKLVTNTVTNTKKPQETNFSKAIKKYIETSDPKYLKEAVEEIKEHSNPEKKEGDKNRRKVEAEMLESYKCPVYSKPNQPPIPDKVPKVNAKVGETVVPRDGHNDAFEQWIRTSIKPESKPIPIQINNLYYIWRTCHDSKVRPSHALNDGKIFHINRPPHIGHPGEDYNCRCKADHNIPTWININE